jgi:hypothetical protein
MATLIISCSAMAADKNARDYHNGESHGMGIGGTVFDTWGFSYRHYFPSKLGVVGNLGGWWTGETGHLGVALGASYTLAHHYFANSSLPSSSLRIFGIAYLAGIYHKGYSYEIRKSSPNEEIINYFNLGLGVGPGAEFFFTENFALHLELPWMTFFSFSKLKSTLKSSHPHFGGGVTYYF